MKPERRFDPHAFNPEKFLEREKKKAAASNFPPPGLFLPIAFSRERLEALIARISGDNPDAFYLGRDSTRNRSLTAFWKKEIGKELTVFGIAADPVLITYLFVGILSHPLYKKTARKYKSA